VPEPINFVSGLSSARIGTPAAKRLGGWHYLSAIQPSLQGVFLARWDRASMDLATRVGLGASILVVDDNELNRDALSRLLRLHQYNVDSAAQGWEALSLINARSFDLVILDIEMPG
jgi:hypothetical protein